MIADRAPGRTFCSLEAPPFPGILLRKPPKKPGGNSWLLRSQWAINHDKPKVITPKGSLQLTSVKGDVLPADIAMIDGACLRIGMVPICGLLDPSCLMCRFRASPVRGAIDLLWSLDLLVFHRLL